MPPQDSSLELAHVVPKERRAQGTKLVDEAAKRPDVCGVVVGATGPDLGRHVVGGPNLGFGVTVLHHLAHVHVSYFDRAVFCEEAVGGLKVTVEDVAFVQGLRNGVQRWEGGGGE